MKLSAPLRVTWDWNWPPLLFPDRKEAPMGRDRALLLAGELARAQVLLLEIGYPRDSDIEDGTLGSALEAAAAQSSVVLSARAVSMLGDVRASTGEVWLDATPAEGASVPAPHFPWSFDGPEWPGLRIYLTADNCRMAAELIAAAVSKGARKISLPIPPLFGSFLKSPERILPTWKDLMLLADRLESLCTRFPDIDLRVHFQTLWMMLREKGLTVSGDEAPGHGGCQAASALAYIDPSGVLYPCSALPVAVGRVESGDLSRAWSGEEVGLLRAAIAKTPPRCEECSLWKECRGGCRGWAHYLAGGWEEPGPDCARRSESGKALS